MSTVQIFVYRPGLERTLHIRDFMDPLKVLADDQRYLRRALEGLAQLADDPHLSGRKRLGESLLDYFSLDLNWIAADQEDVLALLAGKPCIARSVGAIAQRTHDSHLAIRRLLPPVTHPLKQIAARGLAEDPSAFSIAALVLCQFLRQHADRQNATLLALGDIALTPADLGDLAIEMAIRRGLDL